MTWTPETPISQDQEPSKPTRPRRGCTFFLGIVFVIFVAGAMLFLTFGAFFVGPRMPTFGEALGVVRLDYPIYDGTEAVQEIERYAKNDNIRGIILRIDTPGGAVGASQEIYQAILEARKSKTVFASMGNTAASGGYYVAAAADRIFANPGTMTGSIGVIFEMTNWEELVQKVGLRFEVIKSGDFKDIGSPNREMTSDERRILQGMIDDVHEQFVEAIVSSRAKPLEAVLKKAKEGSNLILGEPLPADASIHDLVSQIADGRLYSGRQALELGLVDELGTMQDTVKKMAEELDMDDPRLVESKRAPSFMDLLSSKVGALLPPVAAGEGARLSYRLYFR